MNMIVEKIEFGSLPEFNTFERISMLNELLVNGLCTVNFIKLDGTTREMICTLNVDLIPEEYKPKGQKKTRDNNNVLSVYSPKDGWRSFKVDNVISIEVYDEA